MGGGKGNAKNVRKRESAVKPEQTISNGDYNKEKIDKKHVQMNFAQCYLIFSVVFAVFSLAMVIVLVNKGELNNIKERRLYTEDNKKDSIKDDDDHLVEALDEADSLFFQGNLKGSLSRFSRIIVSHPRSPRGLWGYARALDAIASEEKNFDFLSEAIPIMYDVITSPEVTLGLTRVILPRLTELYAFKEPPSSLDKLWSFLRHRHANNLEIQHLFIKKLSRYPETMERAERLYKELIEDDPSDCVSMALLGRFYLNKRKEYGKAVDFLQRAIDIDCDGVRQTNFYLDLGEAYIRIDELKKADEVHVLGDKRGLFLSRYQRSTNNADTPLTARPWWSYEETTYKESLMLLEENWEDIRDEAVNILETDKRRYIEDREDLTDEGLWGKLLLYRNGRKHHQNCKRAPKTCQLLSHIPDATTLTRGQIKFSVLTPGTHLWAHCGPTNCRIRAHLGLQIPEGPLLRICNETRTWTEGKFIIFDDSFEHEVWHRGTEGHRLVLIVDFWHPDISIEQRKTLKPFN